MEGVQSPKGPIPAMVDETDCEVAYSNAANANMLASQFQSYSEVDTTTNDPLQGH